MWSRAPNPVAVANAEAKDALTATTAEDARDAKTDMATAAAHKGFSAGSYRDMTRVAWLSPDMWTELFLDDGDNLVKEIDILIKNLEEYRDAIAAGDADTLRRLLAEGKARKEEVDGK